MRISLIVENKGIKLRVGNPFSNLFEKKKKSYFKKASVQIRCHGFFNILKSIYCLTLPKITIGFLLRKNG